MGTEKLIKRRGLPEGKMVLDQADVPMMLEHCRKMIRDGATSQIFGILNMAAALYNFNKFKLWKNTDDPYESFEDAVDGEFGISKRHAYRYAEIGEQISSVIAGGGCVTQRMIEEQMSRALYETRFGFRKIRELARTQDGIQRLLTAKNEEDLEELMTSLKDGAQEIRAEMDAKPKTALKSAMNKRYSMQNPPEQTDITILFSATIRQIDELNRKYLAKLQAAVTSIPPDMLRTSLKYPKKAQAMWNALREMEARLLEIAGIWPDQVGEVGKMLTQVRAVVDNQPVPEPRKRQRRIQIPDKIEAVDFEELGDGKAIADQIMKSLDPLHPDNIIA